jgi:hypothetical protein
MRAAVTIREIRFVAARTAAEVGITEIVSRLILAIIV